jgi:hypothetical protein
MKTVLVFTATALAALSIASTASAPIFMQYGRQAHTAHSLPHCAPHVSKLCGHTCIPKGKVCHVTPGGRPATGKGE